SVWAPNRVEHHNDCGEERDRLPDRWVVIVHPLPTIPASERSCDREHGCLHRSSRQADPKHLGQMRKLMRMRYAFWLCVLATPAAAQPDISSGNYLLPYCQAWVQGGQPRDTGM